MSTKILIECILQTQCPECRMPDDMLQRPFIPETEMPLEIDGDMPALPRFPQQGIPSLIPPWLTQPEIPMMPGMQPTPECPECRKCPNAADSRNARDAANAGMQPTPGMRDAANARYAAHSRYARMPQMPGMP